MRDWHAVLFYAIKASLHLGFVPYAGPAALSSCGRAMLGFSLDSQQLSGAANDAERTVGLAINALDCLLCGCKFGEGICRNQA